MKHIVSIAVVVAFLSLTIVAQNNKEIANAAKTSQKATQALDEIMAIPEKSIPTDLIRKAKAVAVFPGVLKGAFIVGGQGGEGLIIKKTGNTWGAPTVSK